MKFSNTILTFLGIAGVSAAQSTTECQTTGIQCDASCHNIVVCPAENAQPITLVRCFEITGNYCGYNQTASAYQCIETHCSNPTAPHPFLCIQPGTFPSAYKCDTSYICTEPNTTPAVECICQEGEYFNTTSQSCTTAPKCPRDPVDCKNLGESGMIDNFCYICNDNLDAVVYRCNGKQWRQTEGIRAATCGPYTGPPIGGDNGITTTSTTTNRTPIGPIIRCTDEGLRLPDYLDCHSYYLCDANLVPKHKICPPKYKYDNTQLGCILGDC